MDHPALGESPRAMFVNRLAKGGERRNRGIAYDDVFLKETMPTSRSEKGKIQNCVGLSKQLLPNEKCRRFSSMKHNI